MKQIFIVLLLVFTGQWGIAQYDISGTVTDAGSGETLVGATIYIPEISKGTVATSDGSYHLEHLPSGMLTLEFSFIGYSTIVKKVQLSGQDETVNVALVPTIIQTQEVVISSSSYTTQHENAVKIETIGAKQIENSGAPTVVAAITNIPGVDMISKGNGSFTSLDHLRRFLQ